MIGRCSTCGNKVFHLWEHPRSTCGNGAFHLWAHNHGFHGTNHGIHGAAIDFALWGSSLPRTLR